MVETEQTSKTSVSFAVPDPMVANRKNHVPNWFQRFLFLLLCKTFMKALIYFYLVEAKEWKRFPTRQSNSLQLEAVPQRKTSQSRSRLWISSLLTTISLSSFFTPVFCSWLFTFSTTFYTTFNSNSDPGVVSASIKTIKQSSRVWQRRKPIPPWSRKQATPWLE